MNINILWTNIDLLRIDIRIIFKWGFWICEFSSFLLKYDFLTYKFYVQIRVLVLLMFKLGFRIDYIL